MSVSLYILDTPYILARYCQHPVAVFGTRAAVCIPFHTPLALLKRKQESLIVEIKYEFLL